MALVTCEACGQQLSDVTPTCIHGGTPRPELSGTGRAPASAPPDSARSGRFNPAAAALLSILVPGAGQMYKGERRQGLIWFVVVELCYVAGLVMLVLSVSPLVARVLLLLGVVFHIACVVHASGYFREGAGVASRT